MNYRVSSDYRCMGDGGELVDLRLIGSISFEREWASMAKKPDLKVVTLHESNFRDPVAALRQLATDVEAGKFGAVGCVGVVILGDTLEVFGMGEDSEGPSVGMLLHAGFLRLSRGLEEHGMPPCPACA